MGRIGFQLQPQAPNDDPEIFDPKLGTERPGPFEQLLMRHDAPWRCSERRQDVILYPCQMDELATPSDLTLADVDLDRTNFDDVK